MEFETFDETELLVERSWPELALDEIGFLAFSVVCFL